MVVWILREWVKNTLILLKDFAIPVLAMNIGMAYVAYGSISYYLLIAICVYPMAKSVRKVIG